jgi:hypothetical protein
MCITYKAAILSIVVVVVKRGLIFFKKDKNCNNVKESALSVTINIINCKGHIE